MQFRYCVHIDNLYISFSDKKSMIGSEEYQSGAVLYRDSNTNDIIGIEIINFSDFNEDRVQISENDALDLTVPFKFLKGVIQFHELEEYDPKAFENVLSQWGFHRVHISKQEKESPSENVFNFPLKEPYFKRVSLNSRLAPIT